MKTIRIGRVVGVLALTGAVLASTAPVASADQIRKDQWALRAFAAESAWKESTGEGVTVAILDTGVKRDHPDIKNNVLPGIRLAGGSAGDKPADHGTSMASIIAGHGSGSGGRDGVKGLAPNAKLLPIDIYEDASNDKAASQQLVRGLRYAVDNGAKVINASTTQFASRPSEKEAIAYALNKGAVIVTSSGNSPGDRLAGLAAHPGVVAVGAVDQGLKHWDQSRSGAGLTLTAPGTNIRAASAEEEYSLSEGTSNSAAYVSAALALILSKFPDLTPAQAVTRLTETALMPPHAKDRKVPDKDYGYGIIRPHSALTEDIPPGPKDGPLDIPPPPKEKPRGIPDVTSPESEYDAKSGSDSDSGFPFLALGGGVAALAAVGVGAFLLINRSKRQSNGAPPHYGPPGGPPYGTQGHGQPQGPPSPYGQQPPPQSQPPQQPRW